MNPNKKYLYLVIAALVVIILLILGALLLNRQSEPPPFTDVPPISPTTIPTPYLTQKSAAQTDYYVGDPNSGNHTVYIQEKDSTSYYIERGAETLKHPNLEGYVSEYGNFDFTAYGPWYDAAGYRSHVFLKSGIAVIAHPADQSVAEVWHFAPNLTQQQFYSQFSQDFFPEPPPRSQH